MSGDLKLLFAQYVAQNVFNPGFSTLVANLLYTDTIERRKKLELQEQHDLYIRGTKQKLYLTNPLEAYVGKPFHNVVVACDSWDEVLFVGVKQKDGKVVLNPEPNYRIKEGDRGFVICNSEEHKEKLKDVAEGAVVKDTQQEEPTPVAAKKALQPKQKTNAADSDDEDDKKEDDEKDAKKDSRIIDEEGFETKPEYSYHISNSSTSSLEDISVDNMKGVPHWQTLGHILICGNPNLSNILSELVFELRREYWKVVPIVILSPQPPSAEVLEEISSLPEVYYLKGSSGSVEDLKKAGADSKKAKILILGAWSDPRKKISESAKKDAVSITGVRNTLEKDLSTSAQIMTVLGKSAGGGPSVDKKAEQLLNSPLHSTAGLISYDIFEYLMEQNKDFGALMGQLIKSVITTMRVKEAQAKLGKKSYSQMLTHYAETRRQILLGVFHEEKDTREEYASCILTHPTNDELELQDEDLLLLLWPANRYPICQSLAGTTILRTSGLVALKKSSGISTTPTTNLSNSAEASKKEDEDEEREKNAKGKGKGKAKARARPKSLTVATSMELNARRGSADASSVPSSARHMRTQTDAQETTPRRSWRMSLGLGKKNLADQLKEEEKKHKKEEKTTNKKDKKREEKERKEREKKEKKEKKEREKLEKKGKKDIKRSNTVAVVPDSKSKKKDEEIPHSLTVPQMGSEKDKEKQTPRKVEETPRTENEKETPREGNEGGQPPKKQRRPSLTNKTRAVHLPPPSLRPHHDN